MSVKLFNTHIHAHTEHKAGPGPLNVLIKLKREVEGYRGGEKENPVKLPLSHHRHGKERGFGVVVILGIKRPSRNN